MKEDENKNQDSQKTPEMKKRLAMIRTEVSFDFPGVLEDLESGTPVVLIKSSKFASSLSPDVLRRIGGLAALCNHYGATLIYVHPDKLIELGDA